jgi:hypothetical protein
VYHNWFSLFLRSQIDGAVKHPSVGWKMSSWNLVKALKLRDPAVFAGLSHLTIESWIDRTGRPQWSKAALCKLKPAIIRAITMEDIQVSL